MEDGTCLSKDGKIIEPSEGIIECNSFDLPNEKWFATDDGTIVRFPKDREWDWRVQRSRKLVEESYQIPAQERVTYIKCAADLVGLDLPKLIKRLELAKDSKESLVDVFKRIRQEEKRKELCTPSSMRSSQVEEPCSDLP